MAPGVPETKRPGHTVQRDRRPVGRLGGEDDRRRGIGLAHRRIAEQAGQPEAGAAEIERDDRRALVGDQPAIGILGIAAEAQQRIVAQRLFRRQIGRLERQRAVAA